jgi:hypothetical protein
MSIPGKRSNTPKKLISVPRKQRSDMASQHSDTMPSQPSRKNPLGSERLSRRIISRRLVHAAEEWRSPQADHHSLRDPSQASSRILRDAGDVLYTIPCLQRSTLHLGVKLQGGMPFMASGRFARF